MKKFVFGWGKWEILKIYFNNGGREITNMGNVLDDLTLQGRRNSFL
jgi:hypothetical protein